jgi:hypothetical protein
MCINTDIIVNRNEKGEKKIETRSCNHQRYVVLFAFRFAIFHTSCTRNNTRGVYLGHSKDKNYGDFVNLFYYHAIVEHRTVNLALDHAMADMGTWRESFADSELYTGYNVTYGETEYQCRMRVYGNGDLVLPY